MKMKQKFPVSIKSILKRLKTPLISRKSKTKKPKDQVLSTLKTSKAFSCGSGAQNIDAAQICTPVSEPARNVDERADVDVRPSGKQNDFGSQRVRTNKKKRKVGRTRLNKFRVGIEEGYNICSQEHKQDASLSLSHSQVIPLNEVDEHSDSECVRRMTRAEKEAAACKVKESLPRYLRINSLLGMTFREVQKALAVSGFALFLF